MKPKGIYSKLVRVFVVQMLFISLITVAGVYVAKIIVEKVMIRTALENEAKHYWQQLALDAEHVTPNTDNLLGFLATDGDTQWVPKDLSALQPGFGRIERRDGILLYYIEDQGDKRLYLLFDEQNVGDLSFYFGVVPLSLALVVIYLSAWVAYRLSRQTLSPMVSLAATMREFDWNKQSLDSLNLEAFSAPEVDHEVQVLSESLNEFTLRLQQQLQREKDFSRDISHELRTPLAVIQGSLEILAAQSTSALSPIQRRAIERAQTTGKDMLSMIEILLWLARDNMDVDANESIIVNDVVALLVEQVGMVHNADQHVKIHLQSDAILKIIAPAQAAGIVLGNLLRNACNYTRSGEILITIRRDSVVISDTGMGIRQQELLEVQKPYQRSTSQVGGFGLGLDIVNRLCERYHWQLVMESTYGEGTQASVLFR